MNDNYLKISSETFFRANEWTFKCFTGHLFQGHSELSGHKAVDNEVDEAIGERHHVHNFTERIVAT